MIKAGHLENHQDYLNKTTLLMKSSTTIEIAGYPEQVFDLSQDYLNRLQWDPFLKTADLLDGATSPGVGVRARCTSKSGWNMETEYVSFNRPHTTAVKMTRGPWFLLSFAGSWHFVEVSPGVTAVTFTYLLRAKPSWLSWIMTPLLTRAFANDTKKRLIALKNAIEQKQLSSR